jgi:hypothetical protein
MKKIFAFAAASMLMTVPVLAQESPSYNRDFQPSPDVAPGKYGAISSPVTSKFNLSVGGFVKLDYAYNSVNLGPNGALLPNGGIPKTSSIQGNQDQSILTARQSRLWLKVDGPTLFGAKTNALVETDFYGDNAASGESPQVRMRHAFGTMSWNNTQLLFGQSSDLFAPAVASTVDFRHGQATGTPFQPRVPQIRLTQKVDISSENSLKVVVAMQDPAQGQNTGALVSANGDTGAVTGTAFTSVVSSAPNFAGQIMFSSKVLGAAPGFYGTSMNNLTFGGFGLYGKEYLKGVTDSVDSYGYGLYAFVPVLKSSDGKSRSMTASLEAQAYFAANMNFNSATGAKTIGSGNDTKPAKGYGLYGQAIVYPTENVGVTAGYARRGASKYDDYTAANFEKYNELIYTNIAYDINAAIRVAVEYEHQYTLYGKPTAGTSDHGQINTGRLAAYYFF